jgi:hypothetical protein
MVTRIFQFSIFEVELILLLAPRVPRTTVTFGGFAHLESMSRTRGSIHWETAKGDPPVRQKIESLGITKKDRVLRFNI